jgi:hypothetical protein
MEEDYYTTPEVVVYEQPTATNYKHLRRGQHGGLICTTCNQEQHRDTTPETYGIYSNNYGRWFCSQFHFQQYLCHNSLPPYNDPEQKRIFLEIERNV